MNICLDDTEQLYPNTLASNSSDQQRSTNKSTSSSADFLSISDEIFSGIMATPPLTSDGLNSESLVENECDLNAMDISLTPMSEGSWNRMLQDADNLLVNVDS